MTRPKVLLMTSAIRSPNAFQAITDFDARLRQTLCGLIRWIRDTSVETIVLCDGTMPTYDCARIMAFAKEYGKILETLIFRESDAYLTHGKSYAEGEVLEHAIANSAHLAEGKSFYKVTGRTFVENFDAIAALHEGDGTVFTGPASTLMPKDTPTDAFGPESVWTQFYKCDVALFKEHLMKAYEATDDTMNPIECEYFRRLQNLPYARFAARPFIVGRNGGLNLPYDADFDAETIQLADTFL